MTFDDAVSSVVRLLQFAEDETDLAKMKMYDELAASWLNLAHLLNQRENAEG